MKDHYTLRQAEGGIFACINSGKGFLCHYGEVLKKTKYTYCIKGGPGTGKSYLMRDIAKKAEEAGERVTRIFCSSDPDSLDGILLPDRELAVIDATSPHDTEPALPGITGELTDLGIFLDKGKLHEHKKDILEFSRKKKSLYGDVFSFLIAANSVAKVQKNLLLSVLSNETVSSEAARLLPEGNDAPYRQIRQTSGIGMRGAVRLDESKSSHKLLTVLPHYGEEYLFLDAVKTAAEKGGVSFFYSLDPVCLLPDSIFFEESRLLIRVGNKCGSENETVYETKDLFPSRSDVKKELRGLSDEIGKLTEKAIKKCFALSEYHFALESIYSDAMDFEGVYKLKERLFDTLFA